MAVVGYPRAEVAAALAWLVAAAWIAAFMESVYLRWPQGLGFPLVALVAWLPNWVLTRTAALWSKRAWVAAVPLVAWLVGLGFLALVSGQGDLGITFGVGANLDTLILLMAGLAGGVWPFLARK